MDRGVIRNRNGKIVARRADSNGLFYFENDLAWDPETDIDYPVPNAKSIGETYEEAKEFIDCLDWLEINDV